MSLPPYPGPEGSSGEEPDKPETPSEPPTEQPPGPTHQPYGQQPVNPYGQQPPAYGQQPQPPYGQPPAYGQQPTYGQQPPAYGYGAYTGVNEASRGWSGTAIASFVTSLLCCGIPAIVLGIIGIFRTGEGKGKGRWMAVTGISLGVVGTLAAGALFAGGYWVFSNTVTADNAEVGQCVNTDEDGDSVILFKKDCDEGHDAEIYGVHEVTESEADTYSNSDQIGVVCRDEAGGVFTTDGTPISALIAGGEYEPHIVYEHEETEAGDTIICLFERSDGDKIDDKLLN